MRGSALAEVCKSSSEGYCSIQLICVLSLSGPLKPGPCCINSHKHHTNEFHYISTSSGDSCFSPDSDERYVVYVAADNQRVYGADPATGRNRSYSTTAGGGKTFFETPTSGFSGTGLVEGESASGGDTDAGTKFEFCDDWGERYTGVHGTKICVLDTMTGSLRVLPSMALQVSLEEI